MTAVATLVAARGALPASLVDHVAASLPGARTRWLCAGTAADIVFAPPPQHDNAHWAASVRSLLGAAAVDLVVQPRENRRKRLLIADMDSTLIAEECIDAMAALLDRKAEVAAITERSTRGEIDFTASLLARVASLAGLDVGRVAALADRVTPMPGASVLAATMAAHGATTAIASGGFTLFTAPLAARLGVHRHHANTLEIAEGRLTGRLVPPILDPLAKRTILIAMRDELGLAPSETMAVGDGANDIPMLREAGLGIAFRAKPAVAAAAAARIDHGDLTALLYVQGYGSDEFAA